MKQKQLQKRQGGRTKASLFLRTFSLLVMLVVGMSAWGVGLSVEIPTPAEDATNVSGTWTASSKTLSWTEAWSNAIDVAKAMDLSDYMGVTVDCQDLTPGATFRVIIKSGETSYEKVMDSNGVHQLLFSDFKAGDTSFNQNNDKSVTIQIAGRYGGEGERSVKINRLGLIKVKWWNDHKVTFVPNDFNLYGASRNGNDFTYGAAWHEVSIYTDGFNANDIYSITLNTSDNSKFKYGWMSGTQWYNTLAEAQAANAKITEVRLQVTELGTYTINSVVFNEIAPTYTVNVNRDNLPDGCDVWFTVGDDPTQYRNSQEVVVGSIVKFSSSYTGLKKTHGWRTSDWNQTHDIGWMGYGDSFTTTIRENAESVSLEGCNHDYSLHEKLLYGNITATPEFEDRNEFRVSIDKSKLRANCDAWFTIGDDPTQYRDTKEVAVGTQVTFTMSSSVEYRTPSGWRTSGWNQTHDTGWMGYSSSFTTTIRKAAESVSLDECNHDYSLHEKLLFGDITAAPEFNESAGYEDYDVTFNAAGGWGVAGMMKITDLNNTDIVASTSDKETGRISMLKGHLARVTAWDFDSKGVYLKSWTITRAKDVKDINGETETVTITDGIPTEGIAWWRKDLSFDFSSNGVIKSIQANYGRPVTISFNVDSSIGSAKIIYDDVNDDEDIWDSGSAFREETTIQLKATPNNDDTHKFKQWNLSFFDGDTQVGETKWYFSNQKLIDLKLDRSHTGGKAYTKVVAEPVFEEGTEKVDQNVEITVNGETRSYHVYAPAGLEGRSPVLFSLHGKGGDVLAESKTNVQDFKDWADRDKFIAIYPQGKERNGQTDWLANGAYDNEDVKFFDAIIEDLKTKFTIDDNRIYMTGYAEGAAMTYATAFTSEKFAAFATINGHQEGDTHLQHYGAPIGSPRPVPFVHIQKADQGNMPTIIDNMVARNGANPVPAVTNIEQVQWSSPCIKYVYDAVPGSYPVVYYHVNTVGDNFATVAFDDAGKGTYDGMNGVSQGVFWNFLKQYSRPTTSYDDRCRIEFMPNVEKFNDEVKATDHGWKSDIDGNDRIILQYGDKSGETIDAAGKHGTNVYHTIQLGKGAHQFQFTSNSTAPNTSTMWVTVTIDKVGDINPATGVVTPCNVQVLQRNYNIGAVSFNINRTEEGVGEYRITFQWNNSDESALGIENGKNITISGISFQNNNGQDKGKEHTEISTEFTRYYNYHGRLIAQWNFDLADGVRFNYPSLKEDRWKASGDIPANGIVTYSYINSDITNEAKPIGLTYDGTHPIAVAAGLKFSSVDPEKVQIQVTFENGVMTKSQLVLDAGVKMTVPYVRNTYRNDKDQWDTKKISPNLKETGTDADGKKQYDVLAPANESLFNDYDDCLHHINRDIIYVASSPAIWSAIDNWVDGVWNEKFFTGGQDNIEGRMYEKMNYLGKQDGPCVIEFIDKITIDRIGVNRNFTSSFYTEYIYETTGQAKPYPGFRYVGGPAGQRIADVSAAAGMWENAIAMTFGGWQYNSNSYKDYDGATVSDTWNELNVYQGGDRGEGNQNRDIKKIDDLTTVPIASDGFPVYSRMERPARNESVNPAADTKYHDASDGLFKFTTENGGELAYQENYTPWSLPARGAHVKFEPNLPGVLNVDVLMKGGSDYWIADEFGKIISSNVFVKTGTTGSAQSVDRTNGHFNIAKTDYVKFSFDVYPGKTYYLFSNNGDLGVSGFYYEPYVYRKSSSVTPTGTDREKEAIELERKDVGIWTATMSANGDGVVYEWDKTNPHGYTNQCAFVNPGEPGFPADGIKQKMQSSTQPISYDNKAVHVIYNRHFDAGKWQTICLPYSMNNFQLKQQFGDNAKVVLLRDVQEGVNGAQTTANFVYHMNQDIIAGYPYLIYPSKSTNVIETNAYLGEGTDDNPSASMTPLTISAKGPNLVSFPTADNTYDGLDCYDCVANFKTGVNVPKGSYVLSNGKLTRVMTEGGITAPAFMSYLKYTGGSDASFLAKTRIDATNYADVDYDEATNIEDVLLGSGIVGAKTDVYSINGMKVRSNTDDLNGLPKGIYVVNGKKYIVK